MSIQKKDWGKIEWLASQEEGLFQTGMNVGIVTLNVGAHQHRHLHYEEQAIYVIQGQAISYLDGEEISLTPGKFFHLPAGVNHEIFNIGNIPFQHLLISNPSQDEIETVVEKSHSNKKKKPLELTNLLYFAVDAIRRQFLESLQYAYTIYDWGGNLIMQSSYSPAFCQQTCGRSVKGKICECMVPRDMEKYKEKCTLFCSHGIEVFNMPILYDEQFLGYVQGGYIYQSQKCPKTLETVYDTPDSTAAGIQKLLGKIVKSIVNFCEFEDLRQDLMNKETQIHNSRTAQELLVQSLKDAEYEMTDLRINNHFLFNTLNGMASMALDGGQINLYQSIVDLSKMFHYTLRTQENMVPLKKETEYIKAYLQLQKLRYGDKLKTIYHIDQSLNMHLVPFNFLQPILENAFIHGFTEDKPKQITVEILPSDSCIHMEIKNSGRVLAQQECDEINNRLKNSSTHGMAMIYHKMWAVYGNTLNFSFEQDGNVGMKVVIEIPIEEGR